MNEQQQREYLEKLQADGNRISQAGARKYGDDWGKYVDHASATLAVRAGVPQAQANNTICDIARTYGDDAAVEIVRHMGSGGQSRRSGSGVSHVDDDAWRARGGAEIASDAAWSAEFDRRLRERNRR